MYHKLCIVIYAWVWGTCRRRVGPLRTGFGDHDSSVRRSRLTLAPLAENSLLLAVGAEPRKEHSLRPGHDYLSQRIVELFDINEKSYIYIHPLIS